jgi:CheY-like chemotaxis protein
MAMDLPGILIVDDNEDNRYTLQLMLESDGHERFTCATGGNEAIALIEKEEFSLVLLDLMMPDLNRDEVITARMKAYEIVACLNQLFSELTSSPKMPGSKRSRRSATTTWRSPGYRRRVTITPG